MNHINPPQSCREAVHEAMYSAESDIFVGLVAQVGNDLESLQSQLERWLRDRDYEVHIIRVSSFLLVQPADDEFERIASLQQAGNALRKESQCNHILALCSISKIATIRAQGRAKRAFIIRSLKRPEEIEVFRSVYGSSFFCLGLHASLKARLEHLVQLNRTGLDAQSVKEKANKIIQDDEVEVDSYGQRTRDCYELCDAFVESTYPEETFRGLKRFLKLVFGSVFTTPRIDEYGLYLAFSASLRSGDLARQVGAAILTDRGDVLAVACNEVPRHGGGQHWEGDIDDARDIKKGEDPNDILKYTILKKVLEIVETFKSEGSDGQKGLGEDEEKIEQLRQTGILDITEYGRSVHAEMEALLSCARNGVSPKGAVLYTTTFPCHNCARHIISAGIAKVVYVEPYPKSKALQLHGDDIALPSDEVIWSGSSIKSEDNPDKVRFEPFIGIGPRRYMEWFGLRTETGKRIERKQTGGKAVHEVESTLRLLRTPESGYSVTERELIAYDQLRKLTRPSKLTATKEKIHELFEGAELLRNSLGSVKLPPKWESSVALQHWTDEKPKSLKAEATPAETEAEKGARITDPKRAAASSKPSKTSPGPALPDILENPPDTANQPEAQKSRSGTDARGVSEDLKNA